jgi:hypothetical protein
MNKVLLRFLENLVEENIVKIVVIGKQNDDEVCELPRIIDAELRVGLHSLWSALPPQAGSLRPYSYLYPHTGV